jgi:hypothetical protein
MSEPIAKDSLLAGSFSADLTLTSDRAEGNLVVTVYEVKGDGTCGQTHTEVSRALTTLRHWADPGHGRDFPIGVPTHVTLESLPFARQVHAGNRLVVTVGGSSPDILHGTDYPQLTVADGSVRVPVVSGRIGRSAPGAPTAVTATPGPASAVVSWTPPADDGGMAVNGYTVTASPGGATATVGGDAGSASVSGLTNGATYTFTVHATNAIGNSPESGPSAAVTPATVPDAPAQVTATAGKASATVRWRAPAFDGGRPLTGYRVIASPGGRVVAVGPGSTTANVTGLDRRVTYTFVAIATNSVGDSAPSAGSNAVRPR